MVNSKVPQMGTHSKASLATPHDHRICFFCHRTFFLHAPCISFTVTRNVSAIIHNYFSITKDVLMKLLSIFRAELPQISDYSTVLLSRTFCLSDVSSLSQLIVRVSIFTQSPPCHKYSYSNTRPRARLNKRDDLAMGKRSIEI